MENASKALIMAGSVLIALLIIGALMLMFNNLSSYQKVGEQETREAQVIEFNNQFETYLRDNIRGSDMVSLMSRVIDYNARKGDNSEEQFQEMKIEIVGIDIDNLKYNSKDTSIIQKSYTQNNIGTLLSTVQALENTYQSKYITALSTNISKVRNDDEAKGKEETEKLLGRTLTKAEYEQIKSDTGAYYQYSQFKRVYFDYEPSATKYNENTGRITAMKFKCTNKLS